MASTKQPSTTSATRRKSSKGSVIVTLKLSPKLLAIFGPAALVKEESPSKDASSTTSLSVPVNSNGDNPVESASNTPAASGTPVPSSMPPPTEGVKKKGVKRSSAAALLPDGVPKVRGKPGPKKKARLEDGSIDHSSTIPRSTTTGAHKLGPKANQGAINAGLRALDRTGKPCRKWHKGAFKLKSFTGVVWEIPAGKLPKVKFEANSEDSASGDSSKENKNNSQIESEKSNSGVDVEMASAASHNISSPPSVQPTESALSAPADVATASV